MKNNPSEQDLPKQQIWISELFPEIRQTLEQGGQFRLRITGTSMVPTIRGGRDSVTLVRPPEKLQKNDLPLYRRRDGHFVLHRVVALAPDGTYTMCGDHQWKLEPGIRQDQIVALVQSIERKGRAFSVDNGHYRRWVRFWVWALPLRRFFFRLYGLPGSLKRRITRKK